MRIAVVVPALALSLFTAAALAGDLNPPGPPAPTMKTLDEIEPRIPVGPLTTPGDADSVFKITASGSYYLTGNVLGADRLTGVEIDASGVTLDLMGFELFGLVPEGQSQSGVRVTQPGATNIVIRNGSVRAWGASGVDASLADSCVVEDIVANLNASVGVAARDRATIRRITATSNTVGVVARASCLVSEVVAADNSTAGVVVGDDSIVERCVATGNADGMIAEGVGVRFVDCLSSNNTVNGFVAADAAMFEGCTARDNGEDGFALASRARVIDCNAYSNDDDGISVGSDSFISGCAANDNGSNGVEGQGGGTTVIDTHANRNTFPGIGLIDDENRVEHCSVANQGGATAGISLVGDDDAVIGNRVRGGAVGIRAGGAVSSGTLVAKNTVTGALTPFDVTGAAVLAPVRATPAGADAWDNIAF